MPEHIRLKQLERFQGSLEIFEGNCNEFKKYLSYFSDTYEGDQLLHVTKRYLLDDYMREISRLLHNFVASAMSLIDHTRNIYRKLYEEENLFPEYQEQVDRKFVNSPIIQFVICLRQFAQHYRVPSISVDMKLVPDVSYEKKVNLSKSDLLEFTGWKKTAKEFLEDQGEKINLKEVIDLYHDEILSFYKWFFEKAQNIHKGDLQAVNSLKEQCREQYELMIVNSIRMGLQLLKDQGMGTFLDILYPALSVEDFRHLETVEIDIKLNEAIKLAKRNVKLPDNLVLELENLAKEKK